jgi:hypothetical protein
MTHESAKTSAMAKPLFLTSTAQWILLFLFSYFLIIIIIIIRKLGFLSGDCP